MFSIQINDQYNDHKKKSNDQFFVNAFKKMNENVVGIEIDLNNIIRGDESKCIIN